MSGDKRSNVTIKVNGRFWEEEKRDSTSAKDARRAGKAPRPRIPIPFPAQSIVRNGNEAWDRMQQLRGRAERETSREPGVTWEESEHVEEDERERVSSKHSVTRLFSPWQRVPAMRTVLTTVGAVSVGLLFGFLVLTVFSEKELSQSYRNILGDTVQTMTAQDQSQQSAEKQSAGAVRLDRPQADSSVAPATGTPTDVIVQLTGLKMFVAQAGVFQPETTAQAATEPLEKLGIPHLLYKDSAKQYMFAAAAPTREAVLGFAANLKNKGIDVYVKEFTFPAYQRKAAVNGAVASATPDLNAFFANGLKLAQTLSAQSGQVIANAQPVLSKEETVAMKEQHRQLLEASRLLVAQAGATTYYSGMVNGINQAMDARDKMAEANAGKKAQSAESYAWQVQEGILKYLENYSAWVQQMTKTE